MTDHELLCRVLSCIDASASGLRMVHRNGRVLLGLPDRKDAAARALRLYQPQRRLAFATVSALRGVAGLGLHAYLLPRLRIETGSAPLSPPLPGIEPQTCGVLLGSPEHRVRRAITSYCNVGQWEVAKVFCGGEGREVLEREARILDELQAQVPGVPRMLGLHRGNGVTVMRMPYLSGKRIAPGEFTVALRLLNGWVTDPELKPIHGFPEWTAIQSVLEGLVNGGRVLERLSAETLRPVIQHGDFARWNLLRQADGELIVLDWEWGRRYGMPGIDLAHYFLQDERLVRRLPHPEALAEAVRKLALPACAEHLANTGWSGNPLLPVIASLAYKQGAGHQENLDLLRVAVERLDSRQSP